MWRLPWKGGFYRPCDVEFVVVEQSVQVYSRRKGHQPEARWMVDIDVDVVIALIFEVLDV